MNDDVIIINPNLDEKARQKQFDAAFEEQFGRPKSFGPPMTEYEEKEWDWIEKNASR